MAVGSVIPYDVSTRITMGGGDLLDMPVVVTLHTSSYTPSAAHATRSDLTNQLSTGGGYTQDAKELASKVLTAITNGHKFMSGNAVWAASGGGIPAWKYAVLSITGTVDGLTNPLLAYFEGNEGGNVGATDAGKYLTLNCPPNGWIDNVRAT